MLIYGAIAIPLIAILFLLIFFNRNVNFIEYGLLIVIPLFFISVFKFSVESSLISDTEYWNSYVTKIIYYEHWNEYIHRTCSYTTCSGSGKNQSCTTHYYDCSYVQDHPEEWDMEDNLGNTYSTDELTYNNYKSSKGWNNNHFLDLNNRGYTIYGNGYFTNYNQDTLKVISVTEPHSYDNKVKVAKSIYKFETITKEDVKSLGLFEYPTKYNKFDYPYIQGDKNDAAKNLMRYYNGMYGHSKKVHFMILVFKNKPNSYAFKQEAYWKRGNKNEFILCIGLDTTQNVIEWTKVISWEKNERLKIDVEEDVTNMHSYNLVNIVKYTGDKVSKNFEKRSFKEFNYLTVEPPLWEIITTYIVTFLLTIGLSVWFATNEFDMEFKK